MPLSDHSYAIMMGHYMHLMILVNRHIFIFIAGATARLIRDNTNKYWINYWFKDGDDKEKIASSFIWFIYPLANWLCIRYHYHLPFNLLAHHTLMVIGPVNYVCNFVRTGKGQTMRLLSFTRTGNAVAECTVWGHCFIFGYTGLY